MPDKPCTYFKGVPCPNAARRSSGRGYCTFHETMHSAAAIRIRKVMTERGLEYRRGTTLAFIRGNTKATELARTVPGDDRLPTRVGNEIAALWVKERASTLPVAIATVKPDPNTDAHAALEICIGLESDVRELRNLVTSLQQRLEALEKVRTVPAGEITQYIDPETAKEEEDIYTSYLERTR